MNFLIRLSRIASRSLFIASCSFEIIASRSLVIHIFDTASVTVLKVTILQPGNDLEKQTKSLSDMVPEIMSSSNSFDKSVSVIGVCVVYDAQLSTRGI